MERVQLPARRRLIAAVVHAHTIPMVHSVAIRGLAVMLADQLNICRRRRRGPTEAAERSGCRSVSPVHSLPVAHGLLATRVSRGQILALAVRPTARVTSVEEK